MLQTFPSPLISSIITDQCGHWLKSIPHGIHSIHSKVRKNIPYLISNFLWGKTDYSTWNEIFQWYHLLPISLQWLNKGCSPRIIIAHLQYFKAKKQVCLSGFMDACNSNMYMYLFLNMYMFKGTFLTWFVNTVVIIYQVTNLDVCG